VWLASMLADRSILWPRCRVGVLMDERRLALTSGEFSVLGRSSDESHYGPISQSASAPQKPAGTTIHAKTTSATCFACSRGLSTSVVVTVGTRPARSSPRSYVRRCVCMFTVSPAPDGGMPRPSAEQIARLCGAVHSGSVQ
jgi:hypothetical protein